MNENQKLLASIYGKVINDIIFKIAVAYSNTG